jgi:hypothetical protein
MEQLEITNANENQKFQTNITIGNSSVAEQSTLNPKFKGLN